MMKKLIKCAISLVLCLSLLVTPIGVFAEASLARTSVAPKKNEEKTAFLLASVKLFMVLLNSTENIKKRKIFMITTKYLENY